MPLHVREPISFMEVFTSFFGTARWMPGTISMETKYRPSSVTSLEERWEDPLSRITPSSSPTTKVSGSQREYRHLRLCAPRRHGQDSCARFRTGPPVI